MAGTGEIGVANSKNRRLPFLLAVDILPGVVYNCGSEVMAMNAITINAIYQNGIIKPLEPVNLAENERVVLQIIRGQEKGPAEPKIISLEGIWAGLGDPTFEEIEALTKEAHQERLNKLMTSLDE